jgi:hypothetical protein
MSIRKATGDYARQVRGMAEALVKHFGTATKAAARVGVSDSCLGAVVRGREISYGTAALVAACYQATFPDALVAPAEDGTDKPLPAPVATAEEPVKGSRWAQRVLPLPTDRQLAALRTIAFDGKAHGQILARYRVGSSEFMAAAMALQWASEQAREVLAAGAAE